MWWKLPLNSFEYDLIKFSYDIMKSLRVASDSLDALEINSYKKLKGIE